MRISELDLCALLLDCIFFFFFFGPVALYFIQCLVQLLLY